jgi:hypothetical protein
MSTDFEDEDLGTYNRYGSAEWDDPDEGERCDSCFTPLDDYGRCPVCDDES